MSEEAEIRSCWDLPERYVLSRDYLMKRLRERAGVTSAEFEAMDAGEQATWLMYCEIRERQEAAQRAASVTNG